MSAFAHEKQESVHETYAQYILSLLHSSGLCFSFISRYTLLMSGKVYVLY